jgi:hypothetical protein
LPRLRDLADERLVDERLDRVGPAGEEHRLGGVVDRGGDDVPPEVLREERHHRSNRADRLHDRDPQRAECGLVELVEAAPGASDVPVREVVDEPLPGARDIGRPEALARVRHLRDKVLRAREQPAVERPELDVGTALEVGVRRLEVLDRRVGEQELG